MATHLCYFPEKELPSTPGQKNEDEESVLNITKETAISKHYQTYVWVLYKGTHRRRTFLEEFLLRGFPLLEDLLKFLLVKENVFIIRLLGVWPANKEWVTKFAAARPDLHKRCRTLSRSRDFSFCSKVFAPNISTHDLYLVDTTDTKNRCLRNFRQQKTTHDLYLMDTTNIIVKQTLQFLSDSDPDPDPDMSPIYESGCMSL